MADQVGPIEGILHVQDEDFSSYGGDDSGFDPLAALHVLSHGYMIDKPFYEVWGAHVRFKELLK